MSTVEEDIEGVTSRSLGYDIARQFNDSPYFSGQRYLNSDAQRQSQALEIVKYEVLPRADEIEELKLDALLGAYGIQNAAATERRLDGMIRSWMENDRVSQMPQDEGFVFMTADVDGLKEINGKDEQSDKRGHDMGNAALCMVGRSLAQGERVGDLIGRIGGDEFLVVIPVPKGQASLMMDGNEDHLGHVRALRQAIEQGRKELIQKFGHRWPADPPDRHLAEISIGWEYLTREQMVEKYKQLVQQRQESAAMTNLTGFLIEGADRKLFKDKDRYKIRPDLD